LTFTLFSPNAALPYPADDGDCFEELALLDSDFEESLARFPFPFLEDLVFFFWLLNILTSPIAVTLDIHIIQSHLETMHFLLMAAGQYICHE
jgi:hypothetical protein